MIASQNGEVSDVPLQARFVADRLKENSIGPPGNPFVLVAVLVLRELVGGSEGTRTLCKYLQEVVKRSLQIELISLLVLLGIR